MAGFKGIEWAPGQLSCVLKDGTTSMLDARAGTFAVSRSLHYGLCLAFEGIRFFVRHGSAGPEAVFLNIDHNLGRFREGIAFNLGPEQQGWVPSKERLAELVVAYLGNPRLAAFVRKMADEGAQGYLRPFTLDDDQSIGVTFPANPVIRMVAARYDSYLGEPFTGVVVPGLVRASGVNGTGRLKLGVNYLLSVRAVAEAQKLRPGAASALFLDDRPYDALLDRKITEWDSSCCLIALADGSVVKIPESNLILPSVTIRGLVAILKERGVVVHERQMSYGELVERSRAGGIATLASVGTAGIMNRCSSVLLVDGKGEQLGLAEAQPDHEIFEELGRTREIYWDIYCGRAPVPVGLSLDVYPLG